jgi:hypothetical protein
LVRENTKENGKNGYREKETIISVNSGNNLNWRSDGGRQTGIRFASRSDATLIHITGKAITSDRPMEMKQTGLQTGILNIHKKIPPAIAGRIFNQSGVVNLLNCNVLMPFGWLSALLC